MRLLYLHVGNIQDCPMFVRAGKRDAVRNNSGKPVDHSGPGLGVGPTNPPTAGRKPEACPSDSEVGFGVGVGVDAGVGVGVGSDLAFSQHKSGQGSGDGVPGGANEESAVRSAAAQTVSSLDELQNNRNIGFPATYKALGRKKGCGAWSIWGYHEDGRPIFHRLNCKCWDCCYCGPRKAKRYKRLIAELAEREGLTRFLTLTLDPKKVEGNSVQYLRKVFNKLRVYLRRREGSPIKYIAVLELQKSGLAHLHLLIDRYIPWAWIRESWTAVGGGSQVFIKFVDVHRIARYLSKYLTKDLLLSAPKRSRRITTSRSVQLIPKKMTDRVWHLLRVSIFSLYSRFWRTANDVCVDEDGMLEGFTCFAGAL